MLDNVVSVKADEKTKMVDITWNDPQSWENINARLIEINYPSAE